MEKTDKEFKQVGAVAMETGREIQSQTQGDTNQADKVVIDYDKPELFDEILKKEFPEITPTNKDFFMGKLHAYKRAAERKKEEYRILKENQRRKSILQMWTYEEMYKHAFQQGQLIAAKENFKGGFVLDDDNKEAFHLLCLYFTNDKRFEEYGIGESKYSLNKGIWLQSPDRGTGKTVLLRCFWNNKRNIFTYKHVSELASLFQRRGYDELDFFMSTIPQPSSLLNFYQTHCGIMYDELFSEQKAMHMGNPLQVSEYIINSLYDFSNNKKGEMWKFHITSNADGEDIEKQSGKTYRSRMPDMFNLIKLNGPNRRV